MICRNCGSDFPSDLRSCPKCRTSRDADALVLAGGLDTLDPLAAPLRAQLARVDDEFKSLLTLDPDIGSPLAPGELMRVEISEQPGTSITTLDELEKLLLN